MNAPLPGAALKDSSLVGDTTGRIRDLSGFQKGFREPREITAASRNFVSRLGAAEVSVRAETLFQELRQAFGYPRRALRLALADGAATIGTPDFDVNLWVEQDGAKAEGYRLVTQVRSFRAPAVVHDARFLGLFSKYCEQVVVEFVRPFQIEAKIDEIEAIPAFAPHLDYDAQGLWLALNLPSPPVRVHVTPDRLTLSLAQPGDLATLLRHALAVLAALGDGAVRPALP